MFEFMELDKENEIFTLWYEVTYLRYLIAHFIGQNQELSKHANQEVFDKCKEKAQKFVNARFPNCDITFK